MSKYSRTRKAICRISGLSDWIVTRTEFKKADYETWKQSYKKFRKNCLLGRKFGLSSMYYSYITGNYVFPPCKYDEAREHFILWRLPL